MKTLRVPRIEPDERLALTGVRVDVAQVPWVDYPYRPDVSVLVAHTGKSICLHFQVREQAVLAEKSETNSRVSEDSCVELFLSPERNNLYYNFEWNCIGTCLAGVGVGRQGRQMLEPSTVAAIERHSSLGNAPFPERQDDTAWSLLVVIPLTVFFLHNLDSLDGMEMRGNLYKCGDRLRVPHYITWNPVGSPKPDFHRPEDFGQIIFET